MRRIRSHLTFANVTSFLALFIVLTGGTAVALTGSNTVFSDDIVNNQVRSADVRDDTLASGGLQAVDLRSSSVGSSEVRDNDLTGTDINSLTGTDINDNSLTGTDIIDDSLGGADIFEASLGKVPDADLLDGKTAAEFLFSLTYRAEATTDQGQLLGDGTRVKFASCNPGDLLLSGGPASVNISSDLLDSFANSRTSWQARIKDNGVADDYTVVVLCADQP
jgi:hypothetical protein